MKKQQRQFLILIVVLVLLVGGYVGIKAYNAYTEAQKEEAQRVMLVDLNADDITAISYVYNTQTYHFVKSGGFWKCADYPDWVIDQEKVNAMVDSVAQLESKGQVVNPTNLGDYGLETPQRMIAFATASGETYTIYVGDYNVTSDIYYVYLNDSTDVHAIYYKILHNFNYSDTELKITAE